MGGFGGNAGLMSAWFDEDSWEWQIEFANCALGKQYFWWFVHIIDLIAIGVFLAYSILRSLMTAGWNVDRWPAWVHSIHSQQPRKAFTAKVSQEEEADQKASEHIGNDTAEKKG